MAIGASAYWDGFGAYHVASWPAFIGHTTWECAATIEWLWHISTIQALRSSDLRASDMQSLYFKRPADAG
jgi:hypothetical protein